MKIILKRLLSYVPTPLPVGLTEFNEWADSIIELSTHQFADRDSLYQALANMIIHASPAKSSDTPKAYMPKNFFVMGLRKGAANQVASYVFQEIRLQQAARLEAAKKASEELKQAEVTAGQLVPGDGQV